MRNAFIITQTYLNNNVISDFRTRKDMQYYNLSGTEHISGMKILPIQAGELKSLIKFEVDYLRKCFLVAEDLALKR